MCLVVFVFGEKAKRYLQLFFNAIVPYVFEMTQTASDTIYQCTSKVYLNDYSYSYQQYRYIDNETLSIIVSWPVCGESVLQPTSD
jgi:hypothetical protein